MKVLLCPMGSHGDVHPFVGLGLGLKARGHDVTLITNGHFEPLARRVGLDFVELGTDAEFRAAIDSPGIWDPMEGFKLIMSWAVTFMRPLYDLIKERYVPGETVVAAQVTAFGARIAQEKLGVSLATVNLQPALFRTVYDLPRLPFYPLLRRLPRFGRRLFFRFADAAIVDPLVAPAMDRFRAELGLPPARRILGGWWFSPQLVLCLFPDWFAPPQPDWPPQARLTGFPLFDERGPEPIPVEAEEFLASGEPPIVFTAGSAMTQGHDFFAEAADACRRLGRRGALLTRFAEQVPATLPEGVRHFHYLPFSQLLPRSAALIHHGGIGTMSQGLSAGIPQLIMPLAHDQPDNAARLERLGVGRTLPPDRFRGPAIAEELGPLLRSPEVVARCRELADRVNGGDPIGDSCRAIEGLPQGAPAAGD